MYKHQVTLFAFAEILKQYSRQWFNLTKEQTDGALKEKPTKLEKSPEIGKPNLNVNTFSPGTSDPTQGLWTPREIMIKVGQFFRQFDKLFWVKRVFERIQALPKETVAVITDVRFKNEADFIKQHGGILIRLERDPKLSIYEGDINDISENDLDNYDKFDYRVSAEHNRNPQDAEKAVQKIMEDIRGKINATKVL